jgi:hypothetical protein
VAFGLLSEEGTVSLSVIDAFSAGFAMVTRRLWLIVLPVLLDCYLWRGPRLSILPLMRRVAEFLQGLPSAGFGGVSPAAVSQALEQAGQDLNLFSLLQNGLMGVPSLVAWSASEGDGYRWGGVVEVGGWGALVGSSLALLVTGVLIGSIYLSLLAVAVPPEPGSFGGLGRRIGHCWVWAMAWGLLLLVLALSLNVGISVILVPVALLNEALAQGLLSVLWFLSMVLGFWLAFSTFFTVPALALQRIGLVRAIGFSYHVVRRNVWATLGLILLSLLIEVGFGQIWARLSIGSWQTLLGILGNAYIGSGVTAAGLIFYLDRYNRWRSAQPEAQGRGA